MEIKFKALSWNSNDWVYGSNVMFHEHIGAVNLGREFTMCHLKSLCMFACTDSNGMDVYEHDIVEFTLKGVDDGPQTGTVKFVQGYGWYYGIYTLDMIKTLHVIGENLL